MKLKIFNYIMLLYAPVVWGAGAEDLFPSAVGCAPGGICYISVSPPITTTTCVNKTQIRLDMALPGSAPQYSAALSALMAGKKINAFVTDECNGGYSISPSWLHVVK